MEDKKFLSVCFTGTCPDHTRAELIEMVEGRYEVKDNVTKGLDILVCADPNAGSSKLQKAEKNGVKIMSYDDFFELMANKEDDVRENAQGDADAIRKQADSFFEAEEYKKALELYLQFKDREDDSLWKNMGNCYYKLNDCENAVVWWLKAAKMGNVVAQYNMGICFKNGNGVQKNIEKAVEWYTKSAEQGYVNAQCVLGLIYYNGEEQILTDFKKSAEWFSKAAEQGNGYAQYWLGYCYEFGFGVETNDELAVEWYTRAAEQGHTKAKEALKVLNSDSKNIFDYLTFKITSDTTATVEECNNSPRKVTIPEEIELEGKKYVVTSVGNSCFKSCNSLISVKLPNTITYLDDKCFLFCSSLVAINLSESIIGLGDECFSCCGSLKEIILPESITRLGDECFNSCSSLKRIILPKKLKRVGLGCFEKSGLTSIEIPDTITKLPKMCFMFCCSLTSIHLPDSITELGDNCFEDCWDLKSVHLPESVKLGNECFRGCRALESINLSETVKIGRLCFKDCKNLKATKIEKKSEDSEDDEADFDEEDYLEDDDDENYELYYYETSDTTCEVTGCGSDIYEYIKEERSDALYVTIPEWAEIEGKKYQVTSLCDECFYQCEALEHITIPDSVTTLGDKCFYQCGAIEEITLPDSVTTLGECCFFDCERLTDINVSDDNAYFSTLDGLLYNKDKTVLVCCPAGADISNITFADTITEFAAGCFGGNDSLESIEIPDGFTSLKTETFSICKELKNVVIPDSVTSLGIGCFELCHSLKSIELPKSITSLGAKCFRYCDSLIEITIPEGVTLLEDMCFSVCSKLERINLPEGIISLGGSCFEYCRSLKSIKLPNSVQVLERSCFGECGSLTDVIMPENVMFANNKIFDKTPIKYVKSEGARLHFTSSNSDGTVALEDWFGMYERRKELNKFAVDAIVEKLKVDNPACELLEITKCGVSNCELSLIVIENDDEDGVKEKTLWKAIYTTAELEGKTEEIKAAIAKAYAEVKNG